MAPPKVFEGFQKADSGNLPIVSDEMVFQYIRRNPKYKSAESSGQKQLRASRASYGDSAIGYVQVKYENTTCVLKCLITPEHSVHAKGYNVTAKINTALNEITDSFCEDCVAAQGGCKHDISFLFWLHRRSEEPSTTETVCYWKKSELSKCGTTQKFLKLSDVFNTRETVPNPSVFEAFLEKNIDTDCIILNLRRDLPFENLSLYQLVLKYQLEAKTAPNAEEFMAFCSNKMSKKECLEAEKMTKDQSKNNLWYELRFGRITASKLYDLSKCQTSDGSLVESVFGASAFKATEAMERGIRLESKVLEVLEKTLKIKIKRSGLVLNKDYPVFGASPDGISEQFVIEVKCPQKNIKNFIKENKILPKYEAQLLLQMKFCDKLKSIFVVADPKFEENEKINIFYYDYNEEKCRKVMEDSLNFWKQSIFTKFPKL